MFFAVILNRGNHVVDKSKVEYPTSSSFDLVSFHLIWWVTYQIGCRIFITRYLVRSHLKLISRNGAQGTWQARPLSLRFYRRCLGDERWGICNLKILLSFYWTDFCPSQTKFNLKWNRTAVGTVVYRNCSKVESNLEGKHVSPLSLKSFLIFLGWCHQYGSSIIVFISPCLFVFLRMFCRSI